jgi:ABC-2 type transport system ATP-binding protein
VRRLNREQGVTVLLTTHDMHDVEALAQRVIVIGQGRLLTDGPFESLRAGVLAERRLYVDFEGPAPELDMQGVTVRARSERSLELAFDPAHIPTPKLIAAIATKHAVEDVHVDEPAIEEVITRFYDLHDLHEARETRGVREA